jgi:hypothetical protein
MKTRIINSFGALLLILFIPQSGFAQNQVVARQNNPPVIKEAVESDWSDPTGPYKVVMEVDETLPDHTIYRPANLKIFPEKDKLPVITFNGPGCNFDGISFRPFFTEIASYGFLVIAAGLPWTDYKEIMSHPMVKGNDTRASISWAFVENNRKGSKYYCKISVSDVAVMGQSCGGIQALGLLDDERITLFALWNSGMFDRSNSMTTDSHLTGTRQDFKLLSVPIAYFVGGTDGARPNASGDFEAIENVPAFLAVREIEGDAHGGTFREKNGGGFGVAAVAWVMWNMKKNEEAGLMFKGEPCGLSNDKAWIEIRKKNIPY